MSNQNQKSLFLDLFLNIAAPVLILNNFSERFPGEMSATYALILALLCPIGYAVYDYSKTRKLNFFSVIGVLNVLFSGGFALMRIEGFWFAVKEAAFPLVLGVVVLISSFTQRPFMRTLIFNDTVMNVEKIESRVRESAREKDLVELFKKSTAFLALSFFLSAALNYFLARYIFQEFPVGLSEAEKGSLLNAQIARMNWMSYIVIVIPSLIVTALVLWHFIKKLTHLTGLHFNEMMKDKA